METIIRIITLTASTLATSSVLLIFTIPVSLGLALIAGALPRYQAEAVAVGTFFAVLWSIANTATQEEQRKHGPQRTK